MADNAGLKTRRENRRPPNHIILAAVLVSLFLFEGGHAQPPPDPPGPDRIVALLEWREDNERFEYRLELFPILFYHEGRYGEGQSINCSSLPETSAVEAGQRYGVYSRGAYVGEFSVNGARASRRSCCPVKAGTGHLELASHEGRFLPVKEPLLAVFPPLASTSSAERLWSQIDYDPEQFTQTVLPLVRDRMDAYIREEGWESLRTSPPQVRRGVPYALDGGRTIAVMTEAIVGLSPRQESSAWRGRQVTVHLVMWLKLKKEGPPETLFHVFYLQPGFDPGGRDARRLRLVDILDIDSDGRSEMLYRVDGYENHSFRVYSPGANEPMIFDGARFGC